MSINGLSAANGYLAQTLCFGFAPASPRRDDVQPYFFRGSLQSADQVGPNMWQVVFCDVK